MSASTMVMHGFKQAILAELAKWLGDEFSDSLETEEVATFIAQSAIDAVRLAKHKYDLRTRGPEQNEEKTP